ncbi:MAG: RNA polymerase sigma factor [Phycisphaerales bacterium]
MTGPMTHTTTLLLDSLKDEKRDAVWIEFDARYRRVIEVFCVSIGLREQDAQEVAQQTMVEFLRDFRAGKYVRGKGRLRSWLVGIAHHRAIDLMRSAGRKRDWRGESAMVDVSDPARLAQTWDAAQQRAILDQAMATLRETSKLGEKALKAFELVALRQVPAETVAQELGMTIDDVYSAKARITKRLRAIVEEMSRAYTEDD